MKRRNESYNAAFIFLLAGGVILSGCKTVPSRGEGWRTFSSREYGFQFKYPKEFLVKLDQDGYVRVYQDQLPEYSDRSLTLSPLRKKEDGQTLEGFVHNRMSYAGDDPQIHNDISSILNGKKVFQYDVWIGTGSYTYFFILKNENTGIEICYLKDWDYGSIQNSGTDIDIFKQIISTVEFIR